MSYASRPSDKFRYRINEAIRRPEVFLIDENGNSLGRKSMSEALALAETAGLDLVEIGPNAVPPVCKIVDFGKFKYELEKKAQKNKANKAGEVKEIRLGIKTDDHDFNTKVEQSKKFLEKGYKLKLTIKMMGRENIYSNKAIQQIERFKELLSLDYESNPVRMGNRFTALLIKAKSTKNNEGKEEEDAKIKN